MTQRVKEVVDLINKADKALREVLKNDGMDMKHPCFSINTNQYDKVVYIPNEHFVSFFAGQKYDASHPENSPYYYINHVEDGVVFHTVASVEEFPDFVNRMN